MNKKIVKQVFPEMVEKVEIGKCPMCSKKIQKGDFKDELSEKEFKISGMCQKCQDSIFN